MLIDRFVAISLLITALSHIAQPAMWATFFRVLLETRIAAVVIALYTLPLGLALLLSHKDWSWGWQWVFIGLGLAFTLKSTIYVLAPQVAERTIRRHGSRPEAYRIAGVAMMPLVVATVWAAFSANA